MARGWESKSVEEQVETARIAKEQANESYGRAAGGDPGKASRQRDSLLLAKARIVKDLMTTENVRYRQFLESSLSAIEKQLLDLK